MKKILLVNEGFSDNLGDQAIKYTIQQLIQEKGIQVDYQDFTRCKKINYKYDEINFFENRKSVKKGKKVTSNPIIKRTFICLRRIRWLFKNISRCFKAVNKEDYDIVLIGGGQLILSNSSFPIAMFTWVNIIKLMTRSKIKLFAVGAGTKFTFFERVLYKSALKKVDDIYLRDFTSIDFIKKNFMISSKYIPDPVFAISSIYKHKTIRTNNVLIGAVDYDVYKRYNNDYKSEEEYMKYWLDIVIENYKKGYRIKLFFTTISDSIQTYKLKKLVQEIYNIEIRVLKLTSLPELLDAASNSRIIISGRMHALIIGYSFGIKIIPFCISDKIKVFKSEYLDTCNKNRNINELIFNGIDDVIEENRCNVTN